MTSTTGGPGDDRSLTRSRGAQLPLSGLRVVDFSTRIASAYCVKLLVDLGADAIRVEPTDGTPLRRASASGSVGRDGDPDGVLFRFLAASTRSVALDLDASAGRVRVDELIDEADVVVHSFLPGDALRFGLDVARLHDRNPALIVASVTPFGHDGPRVDHDVPEFVLQALSGSLYAHGLPGREPLAVGGQQGEWAAGGYAACGITAALVGRASSSRGCHVDASILEAMAVSLVNFPTLVRQFSGRRRPRDPMVVTPGIEAASDGWVALFTITAEQWISFALMIGREDLAVDESLLKFTGRAARLKELQDVITAWTCQRTVAEILELASEFRVPAAPVTDGSTAPDIEHFAERSIYVRNERGGFRHPRPILRWGSAGDRPMTPAPELGPDDDVTFDDLTFDDVRFDDAEFDGPDDDVCASRPLQGVRILDLTAFWAGPHGTLLLAALGADVVKVESIQRPDPLRFSGFAPPTEPLWYEKAPAFHGCNAGKRSVTLNLDDPEGRALFLRLVATADVVIENFTPRVMDNFGLSYETLRAAREDIIMVRMPGYGLDGPWRDVPAFAPTIEAVASLTTITGYADGPPMFAGGVYDPSSGAHAAFAVMAAVLHRRRTGHGQLVELPMAEVGLTATAEMVAEWDAYGARIVRQGNRSLVSAPRGVYRCREADAWIALTVETSRQWNALARLLSDVGCTVDESLAQLSERLERHDELDAMISRWCFELEIRTAERLLRANRIPAARVVSVDDLDDDLHMSERGFWMPIRHRVTGTTLYPGCPFRLGGAMPAFDRPAPTLGEHTEDVLAEVGVTAAAFADLRLRRVVGTVPVGLEAPAVEAEVGAGRDYGGAPLDRLVDDCDGK